MAASDEGHDGSLEYLSQQKRQYFSEEEKLTRHRRSHKRKEQRRSHDGVKNHANDSSFASSSSCSLGGEEWVRENIDCLIKFNWAKHNTEPMSSYCTKAD